LVGLLGLLAFFLYVRSTTTAAPARKRSIDDNDLSDGKRFIWPSPGLSVQTNSCI
jgi:hypothetical protein